MTTARKSEKDTSDQPQDAQAEAVQEAVDKAEDKGYIGIKVDPNPNDAYALTTGPASPSHVNGAHEQAKQYVAVDDPGAKHEVKEA